MIMSLWQTAMDKLIPWVITHYYTDESVISALRYVCGLLPMRISGANAMVDVTIPMNIPLVREDTGRKQLCRKALMVIYVKGHGTPVIDITLFTDTDHENFVVKLTSSYIHVDYGKSLPVKGDPALQYVRNFILNNCR